MGAAYGVGLILIYLLVVAQFKSYLTPLVIMAPIPLTIIGVMPGHALLGAQFTATSMIGMIALAGIIVRNSILLVDFIELQVRQGMAFKDAVMQLGRGARPAHRADRAGRHDRRLLHPGRPDLQRSGHLADLRHLVSTLLTLVVIPVLYYALYRSAWRHVNRSQRRPQRHPH
jgi:multidrug efflux pump subunit AcrB